jgi:hypothetical protein
LQALSDFIGKWGGNGIVLVGIGIHDFFLKKYPKVVTFG